MKIFYDNQGNVMGSVESPFEEQMTMPDHQEIVVPTEIVDKINDPMDATKAQDFEIVQDMLQPKQPIVEPS